MPRKPASLSNASAPGLLCRRANYRIVQNASATRQKRRACAQWFQSAPLVANAQSVDCQIFPFHWHGQAKLTSLPCRRARWRKTEAAKSSGAAVWPGFRTVKVIKDWNDASGAGCWRLPGGSYSPCCTAHVLDDFVVHIVRTSYTYQFQPGPICLYA